MATDAGGGSGSDGPFQGGPFGEGGGLLDELRAGGEEAVNAELAGLQQAMSKVESFAATLADADIAALRAEWQTIETELKRALQSGLTAVEEKGSQRRQASVDEELEALSTEVSRKNDLIAQLSDTVKKLNTELDDKDRRLREDLRAARDRVAVQDEEIANLRARATDLEQGRARQAADLATANAEREALRTGLGQASEALEVERAHQEELHGEMEKELNEVRLANARLENEKRDAERRASDLERRFQAAERSREKAESERGEKAQEASRLTREVSALRERSETLEQELAGQRERIDKDVRHLQGLVNRLRADAQTCRSRVADALSGFRGAVGMLENLPKDLPADEEPAAPAEGDT